MTTKGARSKKAAAGRSEPKTVPRQHWIGQFRPFRILANVDNQIRSGIPLLEFEAFIKKRCRHITPLSDKLLEYLYEKAVDAAGDFRQAEACTAEKKTKEWMRHRTWTAEAIGQVQKLHRTLEAADSERLSTDVRKQISKSLPRLRGFGKALADLKNFDDRLELYAKRTKTAVVRDARSAMRAALEKHEPGLSPDERMELISASLEAIRLGKPVDADSIGRSLRRYNATLRPGKRAKPDAGRSHSG